MSDRQEDKLDALLRSRRTEPSGPDLAERIILRAQGLPQNQTLSPGRWIRQLFAEFHLPRPAYVLASTLILGVIIGFNTPVDTSADNPDSVYVQSLYADEDVL
ncbi:MAG TPA: hypothetical protein VLJ79_24185 [Candidatus Binatia bacterium]|nr:hypothetical protein [Candidatus Binatia bacterium]